MSFDYWLGLRMSIGLATCQIYDCATITDNFSDHSIGWGGNGDRIHRHDALCDVILSAAQSAALAPRREVPSLIPGSRSFQADIYQTGVEGAMQSWM